LDELSDISIFCTDVFAITGSRIKNTDWEIGGVESVGGGEMSGEMFG
jgi:hypothetical protein